MTTTCKKCGKPTEQSVNGYCPTCWKAGPAIDLLRWLNDKHGFNFEIPITTPRLGHWEIAQGIAEVIGLLVEHDNTEGSSELIDQALTSLESLIDNLDLTDEQREILRGPKGY